MNCLLLCFRVVRIPQFLFNPSGFLGISCHPFLLPRSCSCPFSVLILFSLVSIWSSLNPLSKQHLTGTHSLLLLPSYLTSSLSPLAKIPTSSPVLAEKFFLRSAYGWLAASSSSSQLPYTLNPSPASCHGHQLLTPLPCLSRVSPVARGRGPRYLNI